MSAQPIRTPQAPTTYELIPPGTSSTPTGVAATCPHCDWSVVKPYPPGARHGNNRAQAINDELSQTSAEHKHAHLAAYVFNALRSAVGPLGSVETAVQGLSDYGLIIKPDPDWTPKAEPKAVDTTEAAPKP